MCYRAGSFIVCIPVYYVNFPERDHKKYTMKLITYIDTVKLSGKWDVTFYLDHTLTMFGRLNTPFFNLRINIINNVSNRF